VISQILKVWREAEFDFREYVNADDELAHLFTEWVDYYRLKWAIAKVIQPRSIFEIGVRYGYSAQAFLAAAPEACYVGIDLDSNEYGGEIGAIDWARKALDQYDADIQLGDSQKMSAFPGDRYDLIHVDGQQDGDSTYLDLVKALKQGRYILVDGYFWSSENYQGCNAFLKDNKELIEYYFVIPGYAGELLIKVKEDKTNHLLEDTADKDSEQIKSHYADNYYLMDCGGFNEYKAFNGQKLIDSRLDAVYKIATVAKGMHIADAGCGRGEIAYACVQRGATVDAIDYSPSALKLARNCFANEKKLLSKIKFYCSSITEFKFNKKTDRVIASDLIEHLSAPELDIMYGNISKGLKDAGQFVVHTFPNLWYYQYGYEAQRKAKRKLGIYMSPQPRSYYEQLMHINEQSPRVLRDQLSQHFKYVLVWFGTPVNALGSLTHKYTKTDCIQASSIFAIASNKPIDIQAVKNAYMQGPLSADEMNRIALTLVKQDKKMLGQDTLSYTVNVRNNNPFSIRSVEPNPIHLAYHWKDKDDNVLLFDGTRTGIPEVHGNSDQDVEMTIKRPDHQGDLKLEICMVQEGVSWFEFTVDDHLITLNIANS
jgi:2-polyprenyl-3-methyl-5-hydroxy-6-metoxy-1,4-benzoquinol methylase/predicted O-methyltransferase YrrM